MCRERGAGGTPCTSGWPTCGETERRDERGCHWAACVHQRLAYLKRRRHPHARRHRRRARRAVATDQLQPIQRRRGHSLMGAAEEKHLMRDAIRGHQRSSRSEWITGWERAAVGTPSWEPPKSTSTSCTATALAPSRADGGAAPGARWTVGKLHERRSRCRAYLWGGEAPW